MTQLIEDVEKFPGHIACDGASKSEIVVPIVKSGKVSTVLLLLISKVEADNCTGCGDYRYRLCGVERI